MNRNKESYYRWVIVGASFVTLGLTYAIWYSFSVFFVALLKEFGWSRSTGAGAFSILAAIAGPMGLVAGSMVDRLGPTRVIVLGSVFLGVGLGLSCLIETWWQWYLFFGFITGIGIGCTGWIPNTTVVQNWFKEQRGLAIGIISAGIGAGILVWVPLAQHGIDLLGWRATFGIMAALIPLMIGSMALFVMKRTPPRSTAPSTSGELSQNISTDPCIVDQEWASRAWTLRKAMRTEPFWFLTAAYCLANVATQAILAHQVAFFVDRGLKPIIASYFVGMVGLVSVGGKILWAALSDRIGREVTYGLGAASAILGVLSLIAFQALASPILPYAYAFFFGLGYAVTASLPPLVTADLFEGRTYGSIFGALMLLNGFGGAFGAWFTGFIYDRFQSYLWAFVLVIACVLMTFYSVWKAAPRKIRRVPGKRSRQTI